MKGNEAHPPNAKDIGVDPASVRTVLLTGLRSAGFTIHHEAAGASEEPRGPNAKRGTETPRQSFGRVTIRNTQPERIQSAMPY